jgi:hypothetical protein
VSTIKSVHAREILDSRGNPTVEVEVELMIKLLVVQQFQVEHQLAHLKPPSSVMVDLDT